MNNIVIHNLVSEYCIFQYKWIGNLGNNPNNNPNNNPKKAYKLQGRNTIEIIENNIVGSYFKIITYKRLVFSDEYNFQGLTSSQIMQYIHNYNSGHYDSSIIAKYTIKICENNDLITLMDEKYDLLKPTDVIKGITVRELLENVINV